MDGLRCHRVDLLQVSTSVSRNSVIVLPVGKKKQQKVGVGDDSGVFTVFYMKKGEAIVEWKSEAQQREITKACLMIGKDKMFLACGQSICGYTRKGKEFLRIKTNLSETIHQLFVDDKRMWVGGRIILNIYDDCKDVGFIQAEDGINDMTCIHVPNKQTLSAVLACQDQCVRVYAGEKLYHQLSVDGACTALELFSPDDNIERVAMQATLMVGTDAGQGCIVSVDANSMRQVHTLGSGHNPSSPGGKEPAKRRAGIVNIVSADVSGSGINDVIVAREDGSLEVHQVGDAFSQSRSPGGGMGGAAPNLVYETHLDESIRALAQGFVSSNTHCDVIVSTFSGKILSFSADPAASDATGSGLTADYNAPAPASPSKSKKDKHHDKDEKAQQKEREKRHKALVNEVEALRQKLDSEKGRYNQLSQAGVAVNSTVKVEHKFQLAPEEACYILSIEAQTPIEMICLRGDVNVDFLDHDTGNNEKGGAGAILSRSEGDASNPLLATYRLQEPSARFKCKMRIVEGYHGTISCFVVPQTQPKIAHLINLAVKPLSLHMKVDHTKVKPDAPMNELKLSGQFSLMDVHQWLTMCLNDMPARPTEDQVALYFKSTFLQTQLLINYAKNQCLCKSDSATTIATLKDLISREATARKINVNISVDIKDETFPWILELIHPKLHFQHCLTQQHLLVEPLKEVQLQEGEVSFISSDLKTALENAEDIKKQFAMQPQRLAYLHSIISTLYKDKWRLRGHQSVDHRLTDLNKLLANYEIETLVNFFNDQL